MNSVHRTAASFAFLPILFFGGWNVDRAAPPRQEPTPSYQEHTFSWGDWRNFRDQAESFWRGDYRKQSESTKKQAPETHSDATAQNDNNNHPTYSVPPPPPESTPATASTNVSYTEKPIASVDIAVTASTMTDLAPGESAVVPDMQAANQTLPTAPVAAARSVMRGKVSFNFDDGWKDAYDNGISLLNGKGIPVTEYIITRALKDYGFSGYMTIQEVKDLAARGNEIGAHTQNHPHLRQLNDEQLDAEIRSSIQDLATMGVSATTFAYPYGEYDNRVRGAVLSSGLSAARSTDDGYVSTESDRYVLPSFDINSQVTFAQVQEILDNAKAHDAWVILVFHHVGKPGEEQNVSPELLLQIADYVQSQNMQVVTNAQGLAALGASN